MGCDATRQRNFVKWVRYLSMFLHLFTLSVGCYGFYLGMDTKICHDTQPCENIDIMMILISFYMILLSFLATLAELKVEFIHRRFGFMTSRFGRGLFMIFLGSLATGEGWQFLYTQHLTFGCGVTYTTFGLINIVSYACVGQGKQDSSKAAVTAQPYLDVAPPPAAPAVPAAAPEVE